jgi:AcrR family transcriptional regulator
MKTAVQALSQPEVADGRRRRGMDNRARIVAAMMEMVRAGEVAPSAERVAARADVGLRTVFRHFQDMDSLYREMSLVIEGELRAIIEQPLVNGPGPARLMELVGRRARAFETIAPFRRAAEAVRHRSKFIGSDYARLVRELRAILERELPAEVVADPMKLEALDLLLSFEAWARLRREQGLSVERAQAVLEAAADRIIR